MPNFNPLHVCRSQHFDIRHNRRGYWTACDREGLTGGTFLTRRDAIRFALFEAGGDAAYVHAASDVRHGGRR
jgi:hypothetical protein